MTRRGEASLCILVDVTMPLFNEALRASLRNHLVRFERRSVPAADRRPAAVALVVVPDAAHPGLRERRPDGLG